MFGRNLKLKPQLCLILQLRHTFTTMEESNNETCNHLLHVSLVHDAEYLS